MRQENLDKLIKKYDLEHLRNKPEELQAEVCRLMSLQVHEMRKQEEPRQRSKRQPLRLPHPLSNGQEGVIP